MIKNGNSDRVDGSVVEFDANWKSQKQESHRNYFTTGSPTNQIMQSFRNQWEVYQSFLPQGKEELKVLEPGSGRGSISSYFAHHHHRTYLLDTSYAVLQNARQIARLNKLQHRYICADALKLPFRDNSFDIIVHCGLLEHFENYALALIEQYRILKPEGIIIANIVPSKWSVQRYFGFINKLLKGIHFCLEKTHIADPTNKALKSDVYRSTFDSKVYVETLQRLGAAIEYSAGMFPVPSFSYSPEFPFTLLPVPLEKFLVLLWGSFLKIRKILWPQRHPWMCSELWGQHILVVARKRGS